LEAAYSSDQGRPPLAVVVVLKLEVLARHYDLSDREVLNACRFNIAYRLFLGLSLQSKLPHPSTLSYFRTRLGPERLRQVFDDLVAQARRLGLVKDRLRLKDATHVLANIAVPSTLRLLAQVRDRLLEALRPFAAPRVAQEQAHAEALRLATDDASDERRLQARLEHLQAVLTWADAVPEQETFAQAESKHQQRLRAALALAHKVLQDRDGDGSDQVRSVHDPDARRGKHGDYFDGYLLDVTMDADSELLTAINVLPGNGDEGADAAVLLAQEEQAHGNDVEGLSLDSAGFRGPVLRTLTDPDGPNVTVFTPPVEPKPAAGFPPERFALDVLDGQTLTCPGGQRTRQRERNPHDTGWKYRFSKKQCRGCRLRDECLSGPSVQQRTVIKNDYEAEYARARAQAQTPEYAAVRRQHPAIERKLSELVVQHGLRRARYREQPRVLYQGLLTGLVVNFKRLVRLVFGGDGLSGRARAALGRVGAGTVRAEAGMGT
jgi:transposase